MPMILDGDTLNAKILVNFLYKVRIHQLLLKSHNFLYIAHISRRDFPIAVGVIFKCSPSV